VAGIDGESRALRKYPGGKRELEMRSISLRLRDARSGEAVTPWLEHRQTDRPGGFRLTGWAFSGDGKLLATTTGYRGPGEGRRGEIRVWDTATGKLLDQRSTGFVRNVAFLEDSKTLVYSADELNVDGA
jgi:WD40 repeat protein